MTGDDTRRFFEDITTEEQRQAFYKNWELDFAYSRADIGRFRVNAYIQKGSVGLVFRWVKSKIPTIEQLGLPKICLDLAMKRDGMVILTGPTGCGKSTTLAAMLEHMNPNLKRSIITIEDPIEFLHEDKSVFSLRERWGWTHSFAEALKHVRQDPDVILIVNARSETRHRLTAAKRASRLSTLHTPSSYESIDRFVDAFRPINNQTCFQLAATLQGVLYQVLIPKADAEGIIPAVEVLITTPAIKNLIREGKTFQMRNFIHSGQLSGMQTLDQALIELQRRGLITTEEAAARLQSPESFDQTANWTQAPNIIAGSQGSQAD
jgi:twitching motility protein PilT